MKLAAVKTAILLSLLAACSGEPETEETTVAFWPQTVETSWIEVRDCRLSPAEHDGYHIRVVAPEQDAHGYLEAEYPFQEGASFVKLEYSDESCTELARISGMKKLAPGEAPEYLDWHWVRTDPSGRSLGVRERSCAGCHRACDQRDYTCTDP